MALETSQYGEFTVLHGGPELVYESADFEELLRTLVEEVFPPEKVNEMIPEKREFILEQLRQPESVVIFDGNKLVGLAGVREWDIPAHPDDVYFELKSLVVNKAYRGRGLARVLTEEREKAINSKVKSYASRFGIVRYFLTKNPTVIASAAKRGYEEVDVRAWFNSTEPDLQGEELDSLVLEIESEGLKFFKNDSLSLEKINQGKSSIRKAVEEVLYNATENFGVLKKRLTDFHSRVKATLSR